MDIEAWSKATLYILMLLVPRLTAPQLSIAFTMHLQGAALSAVLHHFQPEPLSRGAVPATEIEAFLHRAYGRSKPRTNHSCRREMQQLRPKKKPDGSLDLLGYLQAFQQLLSHCPTRPDEFTLIFWVMEQLPRNVRSLLHNDPTTGQEFDDFQSFLQHATHHAATYATSSDQPKGDDRTNGKEGSKRKTNAHRNDNKKPKVAPEDKPGYVPGLTAEERQRLIAEDRCFRCKQTGHHSSHCKAKPRK